MLENSIHKTSKKEEKILKNVRGDTLEMFGGILKRKIAII